MALLISPVGKVLAKKGPQSVRRLTFFLALVVLSVYTVGAHASEPDKEILDTIANFAERICKDIPLEGHSTNIELKGSTQAELKGLLNKLASLGLKGSGKYEEAQFQGLLQKDLLGALQTSTDCKVKLVPSLMATLLSATATGMPVSVREDLSRFVIEGNELKGKWLSRWRQPEAVQQESINDIAAWHKRVETYLAKEPLGLTYLARFTNQKRGTGSYPAGMLVRFGGAWDHLHSDLERLDEFLKER